MVSKSEWLKREAADQRKLADHWKLQHDEYKKLNARLAAENDRLRAALEEVRVLVFGANRSEARYPLARAALDGQPAPGKEEA